MAEYENSIATSDLSSGFIPPEYSDEIIKNIPKSSVILTRGRSVTVPRRVTTMPVLSLFPVGYWVNGDSGMKQTTKAQWQDLNLTVEELATIVPVPESIINDSTIDIFGEITPAIAESFGMLIDKAAIFGEDKPDSWGEAIVPGAIAAGNTVTEGTADDLAGDIALMGQQLAEEGYNLDEFAAAPGFEWRLRGLRSTDGVPIYQESLAGELTSGIYGKPLNPVENGAWDSSSATLLGGDFSNFLVGIRQDISYKWLDQAVISDDSGAVILNLAQQDCLALRVVMRVGFAVANPITRLQEDESLRYPASVLVPASA